MNNIEIIEPIIKEFYESFLGKSFGHENNDYDFLMDIYSISPDLKREHRQYWGTQLGRLWEKIIIELAKANCDDYEPALTIDGEQLCDLRIGNDAIDTKYRCGSGDSGTLKKFRHYGKTLTQKGYHPIMLLVRNDNLVNAVSAAKSGGWTIYTGKESFEYIKNKIGVNIEEIIYEFKGKYRISRDLLS